MLNCRVYRETGAETGWEDGFRFPEQIDGSKFEGQTKSRVHENALTIAFIRCNVFALRPDDGFCGPNC
jgi:hypothetical protein